MIDSKITLEWLAKADEDFGFASACLEDEVEYFPQICFHYQQSAEKYLKTFLIANNQELKKVHNLKILLRECCLVNPKLRKLNNACELLDQFYIETRYPVHWPTKFTKADALAAKKAADTVGRKIKTLLQIFFRSVP